jgi:hypothetical protein
MKSLFTQQLTRAALITVGFSLFSAGARAEDLAMHANPTAVEDIVSKWPAIPQKVARTIMEKYGAPNEATPSQLTWFKNGPWKKTIVFKEEIPHDFPKKHTDLLQQFIDYKVPVSKYDDLAAYDGSVIVERTKGELSARCDLEEANFLALNLAKDIIDGKRNYLAARLEYARAIAGKMKGMAHPYLDGLKFQVPTMGTQDPDRSYIKD